MLRAASRPQVEILPPAESTALEEGRGLWQAALAQLQMQMARQTFDAWLRPAEFVAYQNGQFVVCVKNAYAKDWLENRLARSIERVLSG